MKLFKSKSSEPTNGGEPVTPEMAVVEEILRDKASRKTLFSELDKLANKPQPERMVRLCMAIDEMAKTKDKVEKNSKGRKIVSMFVQNGSLFHVADIPEA